MYGKTQKECYTSLKNCLSELQFQEQPKVINSKTFNEWYNEWFNLFKVNILAPSTIKKYKGIYSNYLIGSNITDKPIINISVVELQALINSIEYIKTREHTFVHLKDCFNKAYKIQLISFNPMENVVLAKHQKQIRNALTRNDQQLLISALKDCKWKDIFLLALYQGLRRGEVCALTSYDLDFDKRKISINKSADNINVSGKTKTESSTRIIPMFKASFELLQKYKEVSGKLFNISPNKLNEILTEACRSAGIKHYTIHELRHTFATNCLEAGIPIKQVQVWLGHSSSKITSDIYTHISSDFEQKNTMLFDTHFDTQSDTHEQ